MGLNSLGGHRNEVVFVLTGLDIEAKADLVQRQMADALPVEVKSAAELRWTLARTDHPDASSQQEASAMLHCVVRSKDPDAVGRSFSNAAIELALASYPGFHVTRPPSNGAPYGVFQPAYIDPTELDHVAVLSDGSRIEVPPPVETQELAEVPESTLPDLPSHLFDGPGRRAPLGHVVMARSGDKGGSANIGVWVRSDDAYAWLVHLLTVDRLRELLPETANLEIERHLLPNLRAVNFVAHGILGEGVASQARFDPQAKALGEWLRSRHMRIPEVLL